MDSYKLEMFLLAFLFFSQCCKGTLVNPTFITADNGAVCLNGQPASYYVVQGFGNGRRNWLLYLNGGGWCKNITDCQKYIGYRVGQHPPPIDTANFSSILLHTKSDENPEFFNWNKVWVQYCDASSFTGNSHLTIQNGTTYYFRGARIFRAVIKELLAKGMGSADNALLVGSSAGGVAATIYCDTFRGFFPSASWVKCFSDSGYFFLPSAHALPKSCTSRLPAAMCFFPPNLQEHIHTPIFFLMSAFDRVQINFTLSSEHAECAEKGNCNSIQMKALQELRLEMLDVLPQQKNNSLKGVLIYSPFSHCLLLGSDWCSLRPRGSKETYNELFRDWYFDRKVIDIIDSYPCPYNCSASH